MLLRYVVGNFKSIGEAQEFTMFPFDDADERFLETIETKAGKWRVLRRGGFFGPNGSGKSSFVESMKYSRNYIVNGQKSGLATGVNQFKGSAIGDVSFFQYTILVGKDVYEYGFAVDKSSVREEWLKKLSTQDFKLLFTRTTDASAFTKIDVKSAFARKGSKKRDLIELLKESIGSSQKNQLFLSKLSENNISEAEEVVKWFKSMRFIFPDSKIFALPIKLQKDEEFHSYLEHLLSNMDTGVDRIDITNKSTDLYEFAKIKKIPEELLKFMEESGKGVLSFDGGYYAFMDDESKPNIRVIELKFIHTLKGKEYQLDILDESDGTKRLLDLLPLLYLAKNESKVFVIDELDRSLHTKLTQYLLEQFVREDNSSQIIFTAHDVNLLNTRKFRNEEIWFIEKDHEGESHLHSLSDFITEEGQDTLKSYVSGRFGAIPSLGGGNYAP